MGKENRIRKEILVRDTEEYDEIVAKILNMLAEKGITIAEALGILEIAKDEVQSMRYENE